MKTNNNDQTVYHPIPTATKYHDRRTLPGTRKYEPRSWQLITFRNVTAPMLAWSKMTGVRVDEITASMVCGGTPAEALLREPMAINEASATKGPLSVTAGEHGEVYTLSRESWAYLMGMSAQALADALGQPHRTIGVLAKQLEKELHPSWWYPIAALRACQLRAPIRGAKKNKSIEPLDHSIPDGMRAVRRLWEDMRCPKYVELNIAWEPPEVVPDSELYNTMSEGTARLGGKHAARNRTPYAVLTQAQALMQLVEQAEHDLRARQVALKNFLAERVDEVSEGTLSEARREPSENEGTNNEQ